MLHRVRVLVLGLLALLMVGAYASATASAGPFWHHREVAGSDQGKIEPQTPETFTGTGGQQEFKAQVGTTPFVLRSPGVKIKGTVWNNNLQGQIKLELKYPPITIVSPTLAGCQAEAFTQPGGHNVVFAEGHLGYTWDGTTAQLKEQPIVNQKPDVIIVPPGTQIQQGATGLPKGSFAELKFAPTASCGALAGVFKVGGSTIGSLTPEHLGEWSTKLLVKTPEGTAKQHFWNGKAWVGVETGLVFASNPTSLIGEDTTTAAKQEIAIFE
jgi:hypothetical protein